MTDKEIKECEKCNAKTFLECKLRCGVDLKQQLLEAKQEIKTLQQLTGKLIGLKATCDENNKILREQLLATRKKLEGIKEEQEDVYQTLEEQVRSCGEFEEDTPEDLNLGQLLTLNQDNLDFYQAKTNNLQQKLDKSVEALERVQRIELLNGCPDTKEDDSHRCNNGCKVKNVCSYAIAKTTLEGIGTSNAN